MRASILGHTVLPYTAASTDTWDMLKVTDADPSNAMNVRAVYSNAAIPGSVEYDDGNGWTREHLWAQSLGEFSGNDAPATDGHALRAATASCNSRRSNHLWGVVGTNVWDNRDGACGEIACDTQLGVYARTLEHARGTRPARLTRAALTHALRPRATAVNRPTPGRGP